MPIPGPPPVVPGVPDGAVLLDDGTGTYPTDITDQVEWPDGLTVSSYGRIDEFSQAQSAQLSLTVDNTDAGFTVGAGRLTKGQGIRFQMTKGATTSNRFTGRITSLGLGWPGGADTYATVGITAMDRLTDCAGVTLRSMLEQEVLLRSPSAYYTLGEAEGSKTAGDTSGNQAPVLKQAGSGTAVKFGNGTGPVDGMTAATFAGGKRLQTGNGDPTAAPTTFGFTMTFATTSTPVIGSVPIYSRGWNCQIDNSGLISLVYTGIRITSANSITDGATHTIFALADGTNVTFILDEVVVGTAAVGIVGGFPGDSYLTVGGFPGDDAGNLAFTGTVSHVATFDSLTIADAEALASFMIDPTESTTDRFTRLASYADITVSTTTGMSGQTVGPQATSGVKLLDAMQAVATAEDGVLYANGDGVVVLQGRYYRGKKTTPDLSLPAEDLIDPDVTDDNQQTVTFANITRTNGATQTVGTSTPGIEDGSLDLIVDNDADALAAGQWLVAKHADPDPRMGSAAFDLTTSPNAEAFLAVDVGDRLELTNMPDQLPASFGDQTIEGWNETVTDETWSLTANVLPWSLEEVFILDDTTYGVLDSIPLGH